MILNNNNINNSKKNSCNYTKNNDTKTNYMYGCTWISNKKINCFNKIKSNNIGKIDAKSLGAFFSEMAFLIYNFFDNWTDNINKSMIVKVYLVSCAKLEDSKSLLVLSLLYH